jgi:hypothetical protein
MIDIKNEIKHLEELYANRRPFHGELHDHARSGRTADGKRSLEHWKGAMEALQIDFAAILDHKQVRHMYNPLWEDGLFIGGTEPGTVIVDSKAEKKSVHYNMIFENAEPLMELLNEFEEFNFTGGPEGEFEYPTFTVKRFGELIDAVKAHGGFFVHPHPKILMKSDDPLDYWFRDETGLEVFYGYLESDYTNDNYILWTDLLRLGKKIWATAGCDDHACCSERALTTIYAEEKRNASYISHLREGDFVCGPVGIRMCINDTKMGGDCKFDGGNLIVSVADFHKYVYNPEHNFTLLILDDKGVVAKKKISCDKMEYFAIKVKNTAKFYRAEVLDATKNIRIAIGNPIWNSKFLKK